MQSNPATVLIAANPKSGATSGRAKVCQLRDALCDLDYRVEVCESLELLQQRSGQLCDDGQLRAVVSAGGDGTASAVVNLIPHGVPVVILPLGTENLLAKFVGTTGQISEAVDAIQAGRIMHLDAGSANGRLFLIMLGCGFDAEVVRQVHAARRGHINRWTYTKPICRAVRNYSYPSIEVECTDTSHCFSTAWLFAFNLPRYAANLAFCPQACGEDGLLDLCSFRHGGMLRGIKYFAHLMLGRHQKLKDFQHLRSSRFRLTSTSQVPYQIDGDPGGYLPLEVEVLPNRVTLLVPNHRPTSS